MGTDKWLQVVPAAESSTSRSHCHEVLPRSLCTHNIISISIIILLCQGTYKQKLIQRTQWPLSSTVLGEKKLRTFQGLTSTFPIPAIFYHVTLDVSGIMWKKLSHRGHDNSEQLKFKDFLGHLISNSKNF